MDNIYGLDDVTTKQDCVFPTDFKMLSIEGQQTNTVSANADALLFPEHWSAWLKTAYPTGSHYICNPPVENTDIDWVVLAHRDLIYVMLDDLWCAGLLVGGSLRCPEYEIMHYDNTFLSYKHPQSNVNLIITTDEKFYNKFLEATKIARERNLLRKEDRIELFQAVLYGMGVVK